MPKFMFAYHGGKIPKTPEAGAKLMEAMMAWHKGHGSATLDVGAPLGSSQTVSANGVVSGGGSNPIAGYTIVEAGNMNDAIELTKGCPLLDNSTTIEIAQIMEH